MKQNKKYSAEEQMRMKRLALKKRQTRIEIVRNAAICVALAMVMFAIVPVNSGTGAEATSLYQQRQQAEAKKRANAQYIQELSSNYEYISSELANVVMTLDNLNNNEIPAAEAKLASANSEVEKTAAKSKSLETRLAAAEKDKKKAQKELKNAGDNYDSAHSTIASIARKNSQGIQSGSSTLNVIFDAENADDFIKGVQVDSSVAKTQTRLASEYALEIGESKNKAARLTAIEKKISSLKKEADANAKAAKSAQASAASAKSSLESLNKQQSTLKATYESQKSTIAAQKAQAEKAQAALHAELYAIAQQELKEQQSSGGSSSGGGSAPSGRGMFQYPSSVTYITSGFGWRCISLTGCTLHSGTDFGASCGTPVYASAAGTVTHAQANAYEGGNMQVVVNHGVISGTSWMTTYNHLSAFAVSVGQYVSQGQVVGYVGSTGWSTGCHLHFEILKNGNYIDPMSML